MKIGWFDRKHHSWRARFMQRMPFFPILGDDRFARFATVNAVAFADVCLINVDLVRLLFPVIGFTWQPKAAARVTGVASPVVTRCVLHRHFAFRPGRT